VRVSNQPGMLLKVLPSGSFKFRGNHWFQGGDFVMGYSVQQSFVERCRCKTFLAHLSDLLRVVGFEF
jgi:hypothetical protein